MSTAIEEPALPRGVTLLALESHRDARGDLVAFDPAANLPFDLRRAFVITAAEPGTVRGGHANSCHELIVALTGSVRVTCDDGAGRCDVRLRHRDQALWVQPGIIIHLSDFGADTVLLVCASQTYADTRHFERARPDLVAPDPLR